MLRIRACCETENLNMEKEIVQMAARDNAYYRTISHLDSSHIIFIFDWVYLPPRVSVLDCPMAASIISFSRKMVWNWNFHNVHSSTFRSEQLLNVAIFHLFLFLLYSGAAVSSESMSEQSLSGRARYGSTSSLSSVATASSPCTAGIPVSIQYPPYSHN